MTGPILLVVDYNLSRIDEVRHLRDYARDRHGATVILGCFILFGAASIVAGIRQATGSF